MAKTADGAKMPRKISREHALILDLDGTLVTSHFRNRDAKSEALKLLKECLPSNGLSLDNHIRDYFKIVDTSPIDTVARVSLRKRLSEIIEWYELESVEKSELKDGAIYLLEQFKDNFPIAIVSNSGSNAVKRTLEKFNLNNYFDIIIHRDNAPDLKPSGLGIISALNILGVKSDRSVMIGDTPMDVLAAHDAMVQSLALLDGVGNPKDLIEAWPDYMMFSLREATSLLKRLWLQ